MASKLADTSADIISSLPLDVKQRILECLPLQDAMRTSILSTYWIYKWASLPKLILDREFFTYVLKGEDRKGTPRDLLAYSNIVNSILLRHVGPIHKFVLNLPSWFPEDSDISPWIQFVVRGDVREFTLENQFFDSVPRMKLPMCFFTSNSLTHLTLKNCSILSLPTTFRGFPCLVSLMLDMDGMIDLTYAQEMDLIESIISSSPKLEYFDLTLYEEVQSLTIRAPILRDLVVRGGFYSIRLEGTMKIKSLRLVTPWQEKDDLLDLFSCLRELEKLVWVIYQFSKFSVGELECGELGKLKTLELHGVPLCRHMTNPLVLCLLRSSPNLEKLDISAFSSEYLRGNSTTMLLEEDCSFRRLRYVKLECTSGPSAALPLIQFLLACSPALQVMTVELEEVNGSEFRAKEGLDLAIELMRYRRASPYAEIIYKKMSQVYEEQPKN